MSGEAALPALLLLGGCGMIGRNLLKYVVEYNLASFVRVADRTLPCMAYLGSYAPYYERENVEFMQANLASPEHIDRVFAPCARAPDGFQLVVNLAAETRYGLDDSVYKMYIVDLRTRCAEKAAQCHVEKYVEMSTAQLYDSSTGKPADENAPKKPWTKLGQYHLIAEDAIKQMGRLNWIVMRLPIVYGPGDRSGLMPRIVCAAVYQYTEETMKFLWTEDLRINTVHVQDVAAGIWHLICAGEVHETYNLVDANDTTQGKFNALLEAIFRIKTSYYGTLLSQGAKFKMDEIVEEANDGHLDPWQDMCREYQIDNTPLSPFLDKELLYNNHLYVDGRKMAALGFTCSCSRPTAALILDSIKFWLDQKKFPAIPLVPR